MVLISSSVTCVSESRAAPKSRNNSLVEASSSQTMGAADPRHHRHQGCDGAGDRLRIAQREVLRHELADDDRAIGDEADDEAVAERLRRPRRKAGLPQGRSEPLAEGGPGEGAGEDADEGDADLDRRQERPGIFGERQGGGAPAALIRHGLQAGAAGGDEGEFGQGKQPVEGDENEGDDEFQHNSLAEATVARSTTVPLPPRMKPQNGLARPCVNDGAARPYPARRLPVSVPRRKHIPEERFGGRLAVEPCRRATSRP